MSRSSMPVLLGLCLVVQACSGAPRNAGPAPAQQAEAPAAAEHAHGQEMHAHEAALPATAGPGFTVADVHFMQHMIGHHAQAVTMAALVPTHGAGESLQRLAQKIDISQRDEIAMMQRWLKDRAQAVPDDAHVHAMDMPGMLSPQQMQELEAARGEAFERLFLSFMIQHHRGALTMVEELFSSPGAGQDSDIFRFATDVDADQRDEIYVMQGMLDMLDTARGSRSR